MRSLDTALWSIHKHIYVRVDGRGENSFGRSNWICCRPACPHLPLGSSKVLPVSREGLVFCLCCCLIDFYAKVLKGGVVGAFLTTGRPSLERL